MQDIYLGLKFSFSYFTILPCKMNATDDLSKPNILTSMLFFLPFVGAVLALLTLIIHELLLDLGVLGAIISAVVYMILYGFIHTEAIADVVDALYAQHSGKDAYTVIKEPTIGAMGLLYTNALMIIKIAALSYLLSHLMYIEFVLIAVLSRWNLLVAIKAFDFHSSFVNLLKNSLSNGVIFVSTLGVSVGGLLAMGKVFIVLCVGAVFLSLVLMRLLRNRLGFLNGDTLGVSLEIVETALFLGVALWL